jgi:alpha-L-fucosidase
MEKRLRWFNEARFGMFIHWGLYSLLERGEWVRFVERIPQEEYAKLADKFNPTKFDADQWVSLAKEAGMKYLVLTTRHHDGFCLFDSQASDFTSAKKAAKRDFVKEYVEACRRQNMKIGFYYSLLDWRFPGYFNKAKYPESFEMMVKQAHEQVKEIMSNYGKIDYLFYDGGWIPGIEDKGEKGSPLAKLWRAEELNGMVRKLQPEIIINNRSGLPEDLDTPEQHVTSSEPGRLWESCMTIGHYSGWGYYKHNPNLKPTIQLIQYLVQAAAGGGNYLLNVGPKADGTIQKEFIERLKEIGKWLKKNGESIYDSQRDPFGLGAGMYGPASARENKAYLHFFCWPPKGEATIAGIRNKINSCYFLATGKKINFDKTENGKLFLKGLPNIPPDKYDTVIVLETEGKPEAYSYEGTPL